MLSLWILWALCLNHLSWLSVLLWCAACTDKQRCKTLSAQGNLFRMKLLLFCASRRHMGRRMEERLLGGQMAANSIWIHCSQRVPGCWGTKRSVRSRTTVHFIQFHHFLNLTFFFFFLSGDVGLQNFSFKLLPLILLAWFYLFIYLVTSLHSSFIYQSFISTPNYHLLV